MMLCKFPSRHYTFLAYTATSCSWYSTWCLVIFFLENKLFSHSIHVLAQGVSSFFSSINCFSHSLQLRVHGGALGDCVVWCCFFLEKKRFSHTLQLRGHSLNACCTTRCSENLPSRKTFLVFTATLSSLFSWMFQHMMFFERTWYDFFLSKI